MRNHMWYLQQVKLFEVLTADQMAVVQAHTFVEHVCRSAPIYLPGEPAEYVYLLKEGVVRIGRLAEDGKLTPMAMLHPGDIFGELEVIEGVGRQEMAEAVGNVLLCVWPRAEFMALLRANPELHLEITKSIGRRLRQLQTRVEDLVCRGATDRLENLLTRLAKDFGEPHPHGTQIKAHVTRDEMARLIGVSRQTVSESLSALRDAGRLKLDGRRVVLCAAHGVV